MTPPHIALSSEQKLAVAHQLREQAWELVRAGVRMREPGLSDEAVEERVRRNFRELGDRDDRPAILAEADRRGLTALWRSVA